MIILRDPSQLGQVKDAYIHGLLTQRFQEITLDGYHNDELGMFVLAEAGDRIVDLEAAGGVWITTGIFTDDRYGDPDFEPSFEVLEEHPGHCFEMVHLLSGDYGVCTIVPVDAGIDPELLRFCKEYAVPISEVTPNIGGDSYAPGV